MLKLLKELFYGEDEGGVYLESPRKQGEHKIFAFCADCDKTQPMSTACQCMVCGSKAIAVRMGATSFDSEVEERIA